MGDTINIHDILRDKRDEVEKRKKSRPLSRLREKIQQQRAPRDFVGALMQCEFSIIAEIKRRSPSHGDLDASLDVLALAKLYEDAEGVSCISMLTDEKYFRCSIEDMESVHEATTKPMLRKDFVLEEYQVYEARAFGADAVLLIATILSESDLRRLVNLTRSLRMEPFVESHSQEDLEKVPANVRVYGINTRNLMGNLKTDLDVVKRLRPLVPRNKIVVGESGVSTPEHMLKLYQWGARASLTGASIIQSTNRSSTIEDLLSKIPCYRHLAGNLQPA